MRGAHHRGPGRRRKEPTRWSTLHAPAAAAVGRTLADVLEVEAPETAESPAFVQWWRGVQTHTSELTRALDDLGVEQTVVTTRAPRTPAVARLRRQAVVRRVEREAA
jgi:hypothetical protein